MKVDMKALSVDLDKGSLLKKKTFTLSLSVITAIATIGRKVTTSYV